MVFGTLHFQRQVEHKDVRGIIRCNEQGANTLVVNVRKVGSFPGELDELEQRVLGQAMARIAGVPLDGESVQNELKGLRWQVEATQEIITRQAARITELERELAAKRAEPETPAPAEPETLAETVETTEAETKPE